MTMETYLEDEGQTMEEFEADLERRVRDAVAAQFVLDAIAKKEELGVDQNELSQHLVRRAQQSGQDPQEFANHMFEHNHIPELVQEILRGKALAQIVESATVTDASGNAVELKNLRPDGTIGEPEARLPRTPRPRTRPRTETATPRSSRPPAERRPRVSAQVFTDAASIAAMTTRAGPTSSTRCRCSPRSPTSCVVRSVRDTHVAVGRPASAATRGRRHRHRGVRRPRASACARRRPGSAGRREPASARGSRTAPRGRFVNSAVNGLIGDRLLRERPQLAIPMAVRSDGRDVDARARRPRRGLPGRDRPGRGLPARAVRERVLLGPRRDRTGTTYAEMLAGRGWTPLFLRANTGLPLRENGVALTALAQRLVEAWPVPVTRIALVGHSLGGLVIRAAGAVATDVEAPWTDQVTDVVTLGTPHLGAPIAGHRPRQPRARPGCPRPRRSAGSSTGARGASTTWSPGSPRTCRRCRTRATTWSPRR